MQKKVGRILILYFIRNKKASLPKKSGQLAIFKNKSGQNFLRFIGFKPIKTAFAE